MDFVCSWSEKLKEMVNWQLCWATGWRKQNKYCLMLWISILKFLNWQLTASTPHSPESAVTFRIEIVRSLWHLAQASLPVSWIDELHMRSNVDRRRSMYGSAFDRKCRQYRGQIVDRWLSSSYPFFFSSSLDTIFPPSKSFSVSFHLLLHLLLLLSAPSPLPPLFLLFAFPRCCRALPRSSPEQGWPTCCMATALTNLPHQPEWLRQIMSFSQPNLLQSSHSHCM